MTTLVEPECVGWSEEEVAKWIEDIGYKQYKVYRQARLSFR